MKFRRRDGSGTRDYKYLKEHVEPTGTTRLYFRRGGQPKIRLYETPGTVAFEAEYLRAYGGEPESVPARGGPRPPRQLYRRAAAGTLRWLVEQYYASTEFAELAASTKKVRRGTLEGICENRVGDPPERIGGFPYDTMDARAVGRLRDQDPAHPDAGNARVRALRRLFHWAMAPERGYTTHDPTRDVQYRKSKNPDGFRAWTEADVAQYEARHPLGTKARLTIDLLLYTGVRRSDVVRFGPQMEHGGKLSFTEQKGRRRIVKHHALPILAPLRASIDAAAAAGVRGHLVYLVTPQGRPHSEKAFGGWFKRRCQEAGLPPELSAHGLRKLAATRCAEAGATEHELMAIFGWTKIEQAAFYTRKANRAKLEAAGMHKLQRTQTDLERVSNKSGLDLLVGRNTGPIDGEKD